MKLLFICTHNRCRSILAEAITNHIASDRITAASAGSSPQGVVHPLTLKYLHERQIKVEGLRSQSWDEFEDFKPDAVLTLCDTAAREACPIWFEKVVQVHWGLEDPSKIDNLKVDSGADLQRDAFNTTINILERRIQQLLDADLQNASSTRLKHELSQIALRIR